MNDNDVVKDSRYRFGFVGSVDPVFEEPASSDAAPFGI